MKIPNIRSVSGLYIYIYTLEELHCNRSTLGCDRKKFGMLPSQNWGRSMIFGSKMGLWWPKEMVISHHQIFGLRQIKSPKERQILAILSIQSLTTVDLVFLVGSHSIVPNYYFNYVQLLKNHKADKAVHVHKIPLIYKTLPPFMANLK